MAEYDFSQADAAIFDTQHNAARVLREVLARLGFRRIELFDSIKSASGLTGAGTPDLILLDADGEEGEALRLIRTLRNDPGTPNPYACVIATTWQPTPALLMRVTNAGADDLMIKPVSPKQVQERIASLIENRKNFVVTADYTGPDRRKSPREGAQVPVLEAPNTLRLKATGKWTQAGIRQLMVEANHFVAAQKRLRTSIQVAFLVEFGMPGLLRRPAEKLAVDHIARISGFIDDLLRRLEENEDLAPVEAVGRSVRSLAEKLCAAASQGTVDPSDVTQLQTLSRALMQAADPDRPLESMAAEVSAAVNGYRTRLEQMAQAKAAAAAAAASAAATSPAPAPLTNAGSEPKLAGAAG